MQDRRDDRGGGILGGGGVLHRGQDRPMRGFGIVAGVRDVVRSGINSAAGTNKQHDESGKCIRPETSRFSLAQPWQPLHFKAIAISPLTKRICRARDLLSIFLL